MYHLKVKTETFAKILRASKLLFVESKFGFCDAELGTADHISFLVLLPSTAFILLMEV